MNDEARLHEIDMELDKTDTFESPPYRSARAKLKRERDRIIRRKEGRSPAGLIGKGFHEANRREKELYMTKKKVMEIVSEIEKDKSEKWYDKWK